ncbi:unnamed protein product, partial [Cylicocyclus nassatus]
MQAMVSPRQISIALATIIPLLVSSLKCLIGDEGHVIGIEEVPHAELQMCVYETKKPCAFEEPPFDEERGKQWANFRWITSNHINITILRRYYKRCYNKNHRAICYCSTNLCNANWKLMMRRWNNTYHENLTEFNCVLEHLKNKNYTPCDPPPLTAEEDELPSSWITTIANKQPVPTTSTTKVTTKASPTTSGTSTTSKKVAEIQ